MIKIGKLGFKQLNNCKLNSKYQNNSFKFKF
jgi:hypothetical protein